MKNLAMLFVAVLTGICLNSAYMAAQTPPAPKPSQEKDLLATLIGFWDMKGEVEGKPVQYSFEATRALHEKFLLMHMRDDATPSAYEASVYIGYDTARASYVTFWLDNFGVDSGLTVLGYGKRSGDSLVILFNYPGVPFRDTFTYNWKTDTWVFLLESSDGLGGWKTFADYALVRKSQWKK
jgi:hypothetical protein